MQTIFQMSVSFGLGSKKDFFAETANQTLAEEWTPAHEIRVLNTGSTDLYLGTGDPSGGLDSSTGYPIDPGGSARFDIPPRTRLWGTFGGSLGGTARVLIIFK